MSHAEITTTMRYLHHKSRAGDAKLPSAAKPEAGLEPVTPCLQGRGIVPDTRQLSRKNGVKLALMLMIRLVSYPNRYPRVVATHVLPTV
jgi:hypothetical protein